MVVLVWLASWKLGASIEAQLYIVIEQARINEIGGFLILLNWLIKVKEKQLTQKLRGFLGNLTNFANGM